MVRFLALVLALSTCAARSCLAQDPDLPPREPILQIDAGMHTAVIRRLGVDSSCSLLATGSEDKTIRLWHLPDGKLSRVIRPPTGPDNDGKIYAVAVSPDGTWVAAGGFSRSPGHHFVYLFQSGSGAMLRSFGPFPQVIEHLAISPDGKLLAATLRGGQGVRVWRNRGDNPGSWENVVDDRDYGGKDSTGASFDRNGALYTVAYDRKLRRYPAGFGRKAETLVTASGRLPYAVAAHPSEDLVAIGYSDGTKIDVYGTSPLGRAYVAQTEITGSGTLSSVAWSADGGALFAGGSYAVDGSSVIKIWDDRGRAPARSAKGSQDAIMHLLPCADGVAVAAGDPAFGLLRSDGSRPLWTEPIGADMRGKLQDNFTISADGSRVRFGLRQGGQDPVLLDMSAGVLADAPANPNDLYPPDDTGLPITKWKLDVGPMLGDSELELTNHERSQSLAIAPDKNTFVLGTDYFIRSYDKTGKPLWQTKAPGVVWGVNVARERNLVIAACGDGTLRWYRLDSGDLLLSMFISRADRRWIAWTPGGYFTTSVGGETLIGWTVNRTWRQAADFYTVSKFRQTFYRPDIVKQVLAELKDTTGTDKSDLVLANQPPVVRIVSPGARSFVTTNEITVSYIVRSPSGVPVQKLSLYVGGELANAETNNGLWTFNTSYEFSGSLRVKIPPRNVDIMLVAETEQSASDPASSSLLRPNPDADAPVVKPNLFAVLIGVADYDDKSLVLASPAKDVDKFEDQLLRQKGKAFDQVTIKKLKSRESDPATKDNIFKQLVWLKKQVTLDDIAVVYFSGHGTNLPGVGSYLLPVDFDGEPLTTGIPKRNFLDIFKAMNGRVMLFVDACYAANGLDTVDFLNETASWQGRVMTFASSSRGERSFAQGETSVFTSALVDGLGGNAQHTGKALKTNELGLYLSQAVPMLALPNKQTPAMIASPSWRDIPIAYDP